jgi:hypothetical protein
MLAAIGFSLALHAGLVAWLLGWSPLPAPKPVAEVQEEIIVVDLEPPPRPEVPLPPPEVPPLPMPLEETASLPLLEEAPAPPEPEAPRRAYSDAPAPPSAQDWALAGTYALKNSKRYRYNWGLQVRSMMGRAYEGPDQGIVRFRVVIAPNGTLAELETLWSTSPVAEALARKAIESMPPLPPTPTGEPLIFERTITFGPNDVEMPPLYKYDCEPDPPRFRNPYAWDGQSAQGVAEQPTAQKLDPEAYAECLKQLPEDTVEAESSSDQRQLERWRSHRLGNL